MAALALELVQPSPDWCRQTLLGLVVLGPRHLQDEYNVFDVDLGCRPVGCVLGDGTLLRQEVLDRRCGSRFVEDGPIPRLEEAHHVDVMTASRDHENSQADRLLVGILFPEEVVTAAARGIELFLDPHRREPHELHGGGGEGHFLHLLRTHGQWEEGERDDEQKSGHISLSGQIVLAIEHCHLILYHTYKLMQIR